MTMTQLELEKEEPGKHRGCRGINDARYLPKSHEESEQPTEELHSMKHSTLLLMCSGALLYYLHFSDICSSREGI